MNEREGREDKILVLNPEKVNACKYKQTDSFEFRLTIS